MLLTVETEDRLARDGQGETGRDENVRAVDPVGRQRGKQGVGGVLDLEAALVLQALFSRESGMAGLVDRGDDVRYNRLAPSRVGRDDLRDVEDESGLACD